VGLYLLARTWVFLLCPFFSPFVGGALFNGVCQSFIEAYLQCFKETQIYLEDFIRIPSHVFFNPSHELQLSLSHLRLIKFRHHIQYHANNQDAHHLFLASSVGALWVFCWTPGDTKHSPNELYIWKKLLIVLSLCESYLVLSQGLIGLIVLLCKIK